MPLDSLIPQSRDLTGDEVFLVENLLRHSAPEDREKFTPQISRARVVGRCDCGCPTLFLALDGKTAPTEFEERILSHALGRAEESRIPFEVILFSREEELSELMVAGLNGLKVPLPCWETFDSLEWL